MNLKKKINFKGLPKIEASYILLIAVILFLFIRLLGVLKGTSERGAYAYVQLLNFSMPIVEEVAYNDEAYAENNLSVKQVMLSALGLDNLNPYSIIGNEVKFFSHDLACNTSLGGTNIISPFKVSDSAITKMTEEEKAELDTLSKAYDPSLKKTLNQAKPEVLIYHTHESEAYLEGGISTDNPDFSVVGVGDVLKDELEQNYGISVIHDKTIHSKPSYNDCYKKSSETVKRYIDKYGDFKLIIDLHRDSVDNRSAYTLNINDEDIAKIMFVNSLNSPRVDENLATRDFLKSKGDELFPGFIRSNIEYNSGKGMFNQHLADHSVLIECGATINKAQEAKRTAKYIARLVAEYINYLDN